MSSSYTNCQSPCNLPTWQGGLDDCLTQKCAETAWLSPAGVGRSLGPTPPARPPGQLPTSPGASRCTGPGGPGAPAFTKLCTPKAGKLAPGATASETLPRAAQTADTGSVTRCRRADVTDGCLAGLAAPFPRSWTNWTATSAVDAGGRLPSPDKSTLWTRGDSRGACFPSSEPADDACKVHARDAGTDCRTDARVSV